MSKEKPPRADDIETRLPDLSGTYLEFELPPNPEAAAALRRATEALVREALRPSETE